MLRKIRQTLAVLFFTAITLLFLDFTGTVHWWRGCSSRIGKYQCRTLDRHY